MINLLDAFAEFVSTHPAISNVEKLNISGCLKNILDADPEKEIMRRALEHYANEYNWPYVVESPEGYAVFGMEAMEATQLARNALNSSQLALEACLLSMYEDQANAEIVADVQLMMEKKVA
jgi:spore coat polysaccharide biosynthesis protein SpsF (cytidylyltransferase family)